MQIQSSYYKGSLLHDSDIITQLLLDCNSLFDENWIKKDLSWNLCNSLSSMKYGPDS